MSDSRDRIFNSMSRYSEVGRGNDWGSNKVWVNNPQNTVAIPHEGKKNYILYIERDKETRHRWEMIDLAQKARNERRTKKMSPDELREYRKAERIRNNAKWYEEKERIKLAHRAKDKAFFRKKEQTRQKKESIRAARLFKPVKYTNMGKYCTTPSTTRRQGFDVRFEMKIPHGEAHDLFSQHNRTYGNPLQALLDLYYDTGYIKSGVVVDGETTKTHYKLFEQ